MRGIPSPFIEIYERGRETPHPSLLPLLPRKDLFAGARAAWRVIPAERMQIYRGTYAASLLWVRAASSSVKSSSERDSRMSRSKSAAGRGRLKW